jgi:hypothetical protein
MGRIRRLKQNRSGCLVRLALPSVLPKGAGVQNDDAELELSARTKMSGSRCCFVLQAFEYQNLRKD